MNELMNSRQFKCFIGDTCRQSYGNDGTLNDLLAIEADQIFKDLLQQLEDMIFQFRYLMKASRNQID